MALNETPSHLKLPPPVAAYLAADQDADREALAGCFTPDARVQDEAQEYRGIAAIQQWRQEARAKYRYVVEPLKASETGPTVKLRARLTGDFPGSPAELEYTFTLENGKIAALEID